MTTLAPARAASQPANAASSMPASLLQRACACGKSAGPSGSCGTCESEARFGASPLQGEGLLQREPDKTKKEPDPPQPALQPLPPLIDDQRAKTSGEELSEGLGKFAEAFIETEPGEKILNAGLELAFGSPAQSVFTGVAIGSTIAGLAVAHKELPLPIPGIPLNKIYPKIPKGWFLDLTYEGPVDSPTAGSAAIRFTPPKPEKAEPDFTAETARIAVDQAKFREGLIYPPGSPEARQRRMEDEAAMEFALSRRGGIDIDAIIAKHRQGQEPPEPGGLQLTPGPLVRPKPLAPFRNEFRLSPSGEPRREEETPLQKKLSIGSSNDPLEAEADRVADRVLARPAATGTAPPRIQRLSTQSSGHSSGGSDAVPESVHRTLGSSGAALDANVRQDMEARFGQDFGSVRIHTDAPAARSARDVDAHAYTVGSNIVFSAGQYAPGSGEGRRLLAHELTHVVQQGGGATGPVVQREPVSAPAAKKDRRPGSTLPYREATELNKCIQIMGSDSAEYCRSEILAGNFGMAQAAGAAEPAAPAANAPPTPATTPAPARTPTIWADTIRGEVKELLSYGLFDWAVRDKEAVKALALLGGFPEVELPEQLRLLGTKHVRRLLDNLPEESRTDPAYNRIVNVMGSAGVMGFAGDQLSYGPFDWAITDNEAGSVFDALSKLPAAEHEPFLADLNKGQKLGRLISNATDAHHKKYLRPWITTLPKGKLADRQKSLLRVIVAECDNDEIATIKIATEIRFDVTTDVRPLDKGRPIEWEAKSLKEVYRTLEKLPDAHVGRNKELLHLVQFAEGGTALGQRTSIVAGRYDGSASTLSINSEAGDDMAGTAMHETAHAVDRQLGWSVGKEPEDVKRGGWKRYNAAFQNVATEMIDDADGAIKSSIDATQRSDVIREMGVAMLQQNADGLAATIRQLPWFGALKGNLRADVLADPSLDAVGAGFKALQPWETAVDGGLHLGKHIYQEAYDRDWYRYMHEARVRKVSPYQFRNTREWFAEAYRFFYTPDPRGKGAKLNDTDPDTKTYFDTTVDKMAASR